MHRFLDLFISIIALHVSGGSSAHHQEHKNLTYSIRYYQTNTAAIVDDMELRSISSTIAAGSSIGLTIPDAVCAVFVLLMIGGETA
jgi:hypothetical protein